MTDLTGQTIGQYHIIEEIGRGGMATIYRAHQPNMNRDVAIKVLPPQFTQDPTFMARFEREIQLAAELQHPRILPVFDFGAYADMPYFVMRYMPGGTLEDHLRQEPFSLDQALRYISQIAEGLDYLHSRGVIHRDLKASNVLLDTDDNAYLADFGIAKVQEATAHLTGTGMIGTPSHMTPEMFTQGEVSPLVDVYALGVMLYELLTGELPFQADTLVQFMQAHLEQPVPNLLRKRPDLPVQVQAVLEKAMAKDPAQRFQSAGELVAALDWAAQQPVEREKSSPRRWPLIAGIAIVLGGATFLGLRGTGPSEADLTATAIMQAALYPTQTLTETALPTEALGPIATDLPAPTAAVIFTPTLAPPDPVGGGTGLLGFNADGLGYTIDVSCVMAGDESCDDQPHRLPEIAGTIPSFGVWSPDGSRIAFHEHAIEENTTVGQGLDDRVYVFDAVCIRQPETCDASNLVWVGVEGEESQIPSWSPDGQTLAFISGQPGSGAGAQIWLTDADCATLQERYCKISPPTQLTNETSLLINSSAAFLAWSPDGSRIAYFIQVGGGRKRLYAANSDPGGMQNRVRLAPLSPGFNGMDWLPPEAGSDIDRILFVESTPREPNSGNPLGTDSLHIAPANDSPSQRLVLILEGDTNSFSVSFSLSPNRQYAAFSFYEFREEDAEITLLDLACLEDEGANCEDSQYYIQVTDNDVDDMALSWSPDSSLLAFVRATDTFLDPDDSQHASTGTDVYILDVEQAFQGAGEVAITQITQLGFVEGGLTWEPLPAE